MTKEQALEILKYGGVGYTKETYDEAIATIQREFSKIDRYEEVLNSNRLTFKFPSGYDMSYNVSMLETVAAKLGKIEDIYEETKDQNKVKENILY